jgi:hypothetical protein
MMLGCTDAIISSFSSAAGTVLWSEISSKQILLSEVFPFRLLEGDGETAADLRIVVSFLMSTVGCFDCS